MTLINKPPVAGDYNELLQIGSLFVDNRIWAAPMAGVTDKTYRILAQRAGCGLVFTEMVSSEAIQYENVRTEALYDLDGEAFPVAVQIFGSEPLRMARAAAVVAERGAAVIDINMGCPTPKIVRNGEGCALMRDLPRAAAIIRAVCDAVAIPVTVKMRKGWSLQEVNAPELARLAEENGAAALAIHGRTREQFYSGRADWQVIREVKEAVTIPVIGNGDIFSPPDARHLLEQTGCDGVMIARGALGNPWLFSRTIHYLASGELLPEPSLAERINKAIEHFDLTVQKKGLGLAVPQMRKHLAWYLRGMPSAAGKRAAINSARTPAEVRDLLSAYRQELTGY
jgi:tRNA-dihydrouridine synthase B